MVHRSAVALVWPLLGWLPTALSAEAARSGPAAPSGTLLFLDGLESGNDCRWSAAVPPEPGTCSDSNQNGCETDIDCGGRSCPGCTFGLHCLLGSDCSTGICYQGFCDVAYQLTVTNAGGGAVSSTPAGIDCGATCSAFFDAGTEVTLTATPDAAALFLGWSGACAGTGACTLTIDQTTGVTAHFAHSLTVSRNGTGTVSSTPAGIDCGATCTGVFEHGTAVTLAARTNNGSGSYFTGWSGDCVGAGAFHDCQLTVNSAQNVTADFSPQTWNLAFVSSTTFAVNLGSATAYDARCNLLATAAGINNVTGTAFIAWISTSVSSAGVRLGTPRGWVRMDGAPFADTKTQLLTNRQIFQTLDLDETGTRRSSEIVMTGTASDGTAAETCNDWTGGASFVAYGDTAGGPVAWTRFASQPCAAPHRIYCLMKTQSVPLTPPVAPGKKIWISGSAFVPNGTTTPDQVCAADQAGALALVARTTAPAANALTPGATYVRVDGQIVGTGAELIAATGLPTGIWQHRNGIYLGPNDLLTWTGHNGDLTALGTTAGTCTDWTNPAGASGGSALAAVADARWWNFTNQACNLPAHYLICVEP